MERYENLGLVGEGSYGMVMKCRHKESNQIVAIKKFIESEEDKMVKKIAMREIRMLKQLRHENLVNLLEVFRRKKHLYLVFEFVDHTVLDELERKPDGLHTLHIKKISFQVLRGLEFCHSHNIIHRDVKPENILISRSGIVKLCDFGFARTLATGPGEEFTDYVATRWYRAPELLVGDVNYGKAVDIWAVGCLLFEMITGDPLFPGDSDIDQLFHITKHLGNLTQRHIEIFHKNTLFTGMRLPNIRNPELLKTFKQLSPVSRDLIILSLALDASERPTCLEMMKHRYYSEGDFSNTFLENLKLQIEKEIVLNPLLKSLAAQKDECGNKEHKKTSKDRKQHEKDREHFPKTSHDTKKKKDHKTILHQNSNLKVADQSALVDHHQPEKTTGRVTDHKNSTDATTTIKDKEVINSPNSSQPSSNSNVNLSSSSEGNTALNDFERSDTKCALRTTLDISINTPGKNLPDINRSSNGGRAHGHEVIKSRKNFNKKSHMKHTDGILCPVAEKAPLYLDRKKSQDDISDKMKKKDSKKDFLEWEAFKKSSLHLPIVKAKSTKTSPSRGGARKQYGTTIPHIQNIDLFTSNPSRESPTGRPHRDGNLPAV